jgi:sterol desaturase/sphingolipid hydroxylase (fatty acid hydroxylase superfamily)
MTVTQFHHADITLGRWDRWRPLFFVTPDMHRVHHQGGTN